MLNEMKLKDYTTLFGTLCGVFAIILALGFNAYRAAMFMIYFGCFADTLDGYIARKMGEFNEFGIQLDSLSDAIVFSVAPSLIAFMVYAKTSLMEKTEMGITSHYPLLMLIPTFLLISGGIIRLAWFNVSEETDAYRGVPVPITASILVLLMLIDYYAFLITDSNTNWFNYFMHYFIPFSMIILAWFNTTDKLKYGKKVRKKKGHIKYIGFTYIFILLIMAFLTSFYRDVAALYLLSLALLLFGSAIWFIIKGFKTAKLIKEKKENKEKKEEVEN